MTKAIRRGPERLGLERTTGPVEEGRVEVSRAGGCVTATLIWGARKRARAGARNARDRAPRLTGAMARQLIDLAEEVEDDADALMLAIRGALSDLLSASTLERMHSENPELQQLVVANRGHVPLLDEPECLCSPTFLEQGFW